VLIPQYGEYLRLHTQVEGTLPLCWPKHRAVSNELWTLFQLWIQAYQSEEPKLRDAGDWHDRWLPGALDRMKEVFERRCSHYEGNLRPAASA
jgi:hypothetical protein